MKTTKLTATEEYTMNGFKVVLNVVTGQYDVYGKTDADKGRVIASSQSFGDVMNFTRSH